MLEPTLLKTNEPSFPYVSLRCMINNTFKTILCILIAKIYYRLKKPTNIGPAFQKGNKTNL